MLVKKIFLLLSIIFCFIAMYGCQPTPVNEIVTNKGDNKLEKTIKESEPTTYKYEAPTKCEEEFSLKEGELEIKLNAEVIVPKTEKFQVFNIMPSTIMQDDADKFIVSLFGNAKTFEARPNGMVTKEEKLKEVEDLKKFYAQMQKDDPSAYEEATANGILELEISNMMEMIKTLPNTYTPVESDTLFKADANNAEIESINIEADLGKTKLANINIGKNFSNKLNFYNYININKIEEFPSDIFIDNMDNPQGLTITYDEALQEAMNLLEELGYTDMKLNAQALRPTMATIATYSSKPIKETNPYVYQFYFTREINGIPITYTNPNFMGSMPINMEEAFNEAWKDEVVSVIVNDDGVTYLNYTAPITINEVFSDNTTLLPFEEIKTHFVKQMEITDAYIKPGVIKQEFIIDEVRLGYAKVAKQNSENQYLLVPAWDFFGTNKVYYNDEISDPNHDEDNASVEDYFRRSYMTINAIDGSIINRSLGY